MYNLSPVYFVNRPLHVSGIFVAHHQEVYCIYTTIGTVRVVLFRWRLKSITPIVCVCVCVYTHTHTHTHTSWCRVLLEKLTGLQLVKKFSAFHGTRRFITALTSLRHPSVSWASPIQSTCPHPTSWRSILILSTHLRLGLPSGLFPSGFPTKTLYIPSPHPYAPHAQPISFFSILSPARYWVRSTNHLVNQIMSLNTKDSKVWFLARLTVLKKRA